MDFLHGIEHVNTPADVVPVNDIVTAVIGLVGTSDKGAANVLTLCKSAQDDATFGTKGTIPEALKAIRLHDTASGGALVFVVKVKGADEQITGADIVGEVKETGERTGLKLFETAQNKYGFEPMIYIAPRYSALAAVKQELVAITEKTEAMAYIDTPDGWGFNQAIESRGNAGEFATLKQGQKLLFPHVLIPNPEYNPDAEEPGEKYLNVPVSAYAAGLRAKIDLTEGWHVSSSNHAYVGIEGTDVPITFALNDKTCEANLLNAAGITTVVNMFGNGIVEWGNYTTGFPGVTTPEVFECVRRSRMVMKRSITMACAVFLDVKQVKQADIDLVRNTVNQYYNRLMAERKIVYGQCFFDKTKNPVTELAQGHVTFSNVYTPAVPFQRMTFDHRIDLNKLSTIE